MIIVEDVMNKKIWITEVGPRDGLQNEQQKLDIHTRINLVNEAIEAGFPAVEFGYFPLEGKAPNLAFSEKVYMGLNSTDKAQLKVLVDDIHGLEKAINLGIQHVKMAVSVSDTHNLKNLRMHYWETIQSFENMVKTANKYGVSLSCAVSTSFGCPVEGKMSKEKIDHLVSQLVGLGIPEIFISDTAGMANPKEVKEVFGYFINKYTNTEFSAHFHNTRGMGLANVYAALETGVTRFDSAFGGLGGCPYIKEAKGNVPSEDMIHMFEEMGHNTGIKLKEVLMISKNLEILFDKSMSSYILKVSESLFN